MAQLVRAPGVEPKVDFTWGKPKSFEYVASEHKAAREGVVMLDTGTLTGTLADSVR